MRTQDHSSQSSKPFKSSKSMEPGLTAAPQAVQLQAGLSSAAPLTAGQLMQLQKAGGNQAAVQLMKSRQKQSVQHEANPQEAAVQKKSNKTGMPDQLKSGLENLSGTDLSDVKVHYNSDKPSRLNALAYAQGSEIHVGPGQEKHLPHEGWHVVQQRHGRVRPTVQAGGVAINDDAALEREADVMGAKALQLKSAGSSFSSEASAESSGSTAAVVQLKDDYYPSGDKEPHIHIHHGGITYTGVGHAHKALQRGDQIRESVIMEAYQDLQAIGTERAQQIIDWIENEFGIAPPVAEEEAAYEDENLPKDWVDRETEDHNPDGDAPDGFSYGSYTSKIK